MSTIQKKPDRNHSLLQSLADWQTMRWLWITSAVIALIMNLIAHYVFQEAMGMEPCEKCVYIRYAMFCIVFGGLIAAVNPKRLMLRAVGYAVTLYGAIFGAVWSKQLVDSYALINRLDNGADPFAAGFGSFSCSTEPAFHFGLPLNTWFPAWFEPTGVCGTDSWSLMGLNMGGWTLTIFSVYIVLIVLSMIAALTKAR